jgi:lipoprotein-releasing system ATP-binding protein
MAVLETSAVLCAEGLERTFVDGARTLEVLRGVSLTLRAGEAVALVGRSGSGKSTLLHLLGLLDRPQGGEVELEGRPTSGLPERSRAELRNRLFGFVFQHYHLLPEFNVLENVRLPGRVGAGPLAWLRGRKAEAARAKELLAQVELSAQAEQSPRTLSGGEQQRVAVARALMMRPRVLLCDEPTGNLDPETGGRIMDLIFRLCRHEGVAALIVTHDRAVAEKADRVLRLDQGRLQAVG